MNQQSNRLAPPKAAAPGPFDGLPDGVVSLADGLLRGLPLPGASGPDSETGDGVTEAELSALLFAPKQLDRGWPRPVEPLPVGDGWVHAELIDDDRPLFDALVDQHGESGPETVAAVCQEARLPVCPYRPPQALPVIDNATASTAATEAERAHETKPDPASAVGAVVVDLTTHWAGPLATKLLAEAGATVWKVDPSCRPDGFGDRPFVYDHLNGAKQIVDLDLRSPSDREAFETMVDGADLVVESFSRRVMANLGYEPSRLRANNRALSTVSIKAFPAGRPEAAWLAYGPGVHAAEGLAVLGPLLPGDRSPQPTPAPIAYPDFLTGIAAYVAALELLEASKRCAPGRDVEVAMAEVIAPLRATATPWPATAGRSPGGAADE